MVYKASAEKVTINTGLNTETFISTLSLSHRFTLVSSDALFHTHTHRQQFGITDTQNEMTTLNFPHTHTHTHIAVSHY